MVVDRRPFEALSPTEQLARLAQVFPADAEAIQVLIRGVWKRRMAELEQVPSSPSLYAS